MLILLFSIVRNEISVTSVKFQVTGLLDCSLRVFSKCLYHCLCLCIRHCICLFVGQVMPANHLDQMCQRSQVFVFVFVFVFLLFNSCLLIALITCLKGHKSLGLFFGSVFQQCVVGREVVTREPIELSGDS